MAAKRLSSLAGVPLAPTTLNPGLRSIVTSESILTMGGKMGMIVSAGIASTTLTEVLGITGSGVISLLASGGDTVTNAAPKMRVIIDGVTVLDDVYADRTALTEIDWVLGFYSEHTSNASASREPVVFHTSLSILIAGSAGKESKAAYSYYLT